MENITTTEKKNTNRPVMQVRHGHFSLATWDMERFCLQYSQNDSSTGMWHRQQIWFDTAEIRDLGQLMDDYDKAILEHQAGKKEGDDSSSSFIPGGIRGSLVAGMMHHIRSRLDELQNWSLDYGDLYGRSVSDVLEELGIDRELVDEERTLLAHEIRKLAEQHQNREVLGLFEEEV